MLVILVVPIYLSVTGSDYACSPTSFVQTQPHATQPEKLGKFLRTLYSLFLFRINGFFISIATHSAKLIFFSFDKPEASSKAFRCFPKIILSQN